MTPFASHIPVLRTARLTLRAQTRADWPAYRGILTSDRARYMDAPRDDAGAREFFHSELASWVLDDFGYWTAALRDDNRPVAFLGIMKPDHFPETELGWMATAAGEGRGLVAEAACAVIAWAFGPRGLGTLVSYIDPDNVRSIRLAQRLGATLDPDARAADAGDLVFRHSPVSAAGAAP
ncbi:MAG: GNAT family N-acetyltransferase [Pseudomonadota bacterium]